MKKNTDYSTRIAISANFLQDKFRNLGIFPEIAIILGTSGPIGIIDKMEIKEEIEFQDLDFIEPSTVNHPGRVYIGTIAGKAVVILHGRIHYNEGYSMDEVVFNTRVLAKVGIKQLIITNASGSMSREHKPGDIVIIGDYVNKFGVDILRGQRDEYHEFADVTCTCSQRLIRICQDQNFDEESLRNPLVYVGVSGPTFETPAEISRMYMRLGGLIGMSTIPEIVAARQQKLEVLALSCVTNMAAGITTSSISHDENLKVSRDADVKFSDIIYNTIIGM